VRAVLFFSPYCGHCEQVITKDLPPLLDKYGTRLQIIGINVAQADGVAMYKAALERFHIQEIAVPTLIVGDVVLVGSLDIPQQFPGLIEKYLAQGGVDLPAIPGLAEAMAAAQPAPTGTPHSSPQISTAPTPLAVAGTAPTPHVVPQPTASTSALILPTHRTPDLIDKLMRDPAGNTLAIITLLGMLWVVANAFQIWFGARVSGTRNFLGRGWLIPMLALIGLGIATYLAYVETVQVTAVCGPVGDCNAVQQSEYAKLFGVIPIGGLGMLGYLAILMAWSIARFSQRRWADLAGWLLWLFTLTGTLFSIYLTFLEPFVIGAVCAWCLTSAIIMTIILWLTLTTPHYFRQMRQVQISKKSEF
jgi:uncharacterized membrane protein/thiol-disulfide isomerase/thioredoxin